MQSRTHYRRLAIAGVTGIAATALVAGCGSSSSGSAAPGVSPSAGSSAGGAGGNGGNGGKVVGSNVLLAASVAKTEAAKNAKLHLDVTSSAGGQSFSISGDGVIDFTEKKFQLVLALPAEAGISGSIEERVVGNIVYMKLPTASASALSAGGKPWVKLDTSQLGASSGSSLGSLGQDPTQFLGTLRSVSDSVTKVGTEEIRGVKTTHYRAEVDLTKAAAASGTSSAGIDAYQKLLGSTTLPEDVYLDANGVARRFSVSITPAVGSTGSKSVGTISTTVDLFDFGTTDTSGIVAPPAGEVGALRIGG